MRPSVPFALLLTAPFCAPLTAQTISVTKPTAPTVAVSAQTFPSFTMAAPAISVSPGMMFPLQPITGAPYSADMTTTSIQTLADGNQIQHTSKTSVWRDGQGRVRTEQILPEPFGHNGATGDAPKMITIQDPVAGYSYFLDPAQKTAQRHSVPQMKPASEFARTKVMTLTAGTMAMAAGPMTLTTRSAIPENEITSNKVDLGTQIIEGVPAKGTKTTTTFAAGSMGNTQPIEISDESWYSDDLHTIVMSKNSDPRMGVTTFQLTSINRSDPPAAQFQVPSDYTIKETGPVSLSIRKEEPEEK